MGRDGLSEALRKRLDSLSTHAESTRWIPEILHLLLELSDQPVKKTDLSALEALRIAEQDPGVSLKWEDIAKEDGWAQDRDIWKDVDFADSSEDELMPDLLSQASDSDTSMLSAVVPGQRTVRDLVLPTPDEDSSLQQIQASQQWRHDAQPKDASGRPTKIPISEYQLLREVLFLLNGLPTNLFGPDCAPVSKYQLSNVSWDTHRALINCFAEYGRTILPLRKFCETQQDVPLVQAFQHSAHQCLADFDKEIAVIQSRYVSIEQDTVVSLIALQDELRPHLVPLAGLSNVVRQLQEERFAHSFRFLELLYDATCIAQLNGDDTTYKYLGQIFFDCFCVYIRPIRQWMEGGELTPGDKTFFVAESSAEVPRRLMWSDKFQLRRSQEGQLHAPSFLQPAVRKIFNTGKSIVVLKHLGHFRQPQKDDLNRLPEPPLDFRSVCGSEDLAFAPFSELFDGAFERWVQSKHLSTSSNLQNILFESCGLWTSLDALEHIYFLSDGSLANIFTSSVFTSLDALSTTWTDRFTLTELAQEAWSPCPAIETYRLTAYVEPAHIHRTDPTTTRSSVRKTLPGIRLSYKLAWPVQLVITKETLTHYHALFTLLLQLRRAATSLTTPTFSSQQFFSHDDYEQAAYFALRARLLWFTTTFHSYLTTLVLAPEMDKMRTQLADAEDLDEMIAIHGAFTQQLVEEAGLGAQLEPIRACVLDVLDLALRLEDARRGSTEEKDTSYRPQQFGTPQRPSAQRMPSSALRGVYVSPKEREREEDQTIIDFGGEDEEEEEEHHTTNHRHAAGRFERQQTYAEVLITVRAHFDRHLRFIAGGLRGVARASTDAAAAKWDVLAEMLEMGIRDGGR